MLLAATFPKVCQCRTKATLKSIISLNNDGRTEPHGSPCGRSAREQSGHEADLSILLVPAICSGARIHQAASLLPPIETCRAWSDLLSHCRQ
jgi:hypothetical protein